MSGIQPGRLTEKAAYVRTELAFLRTLRPDLAAATDPAGVRAARYSLQTSVTALTDMAYHICAKRLHYAPQSAPDAFRRLAQSGAIAEGVAGAMSAMIGFRNVAAHGYDIFDDDRLREVLRGQLGELEAVLAALEAAALGP